MGGGKRIGKTQFRAIMKAELEGLARREQRRLLWEGDEGCASRTFLASRLSCLSPAGRFVALSERGVVQGGVGRGLGGEEAWWEGRELERREEANRERSAVPGEGVDGWSAALVMKVTERSLLRKLREIEGVKSTGVNAGATMVGAAGAEAAGQPRGRVDGRIA